ncbi:MAG: heavy metal translocating P-type ATPase [Bacilli bacterium]
MDTKRESVVILACHLCEEPVQTPVYAEGHTFCCHGCRGLWNVLGEEEMVRLKSGSAVDWGIARDQRDDILDRPPAYLDAETSTLSLDGVWCASCTTLIEHVVARTPGVLAAKVDFATSTARIAFDASRTSPGDLCVRIADLGYTAVETALGTDTAFRADTLLLRRFTVSALLSVVMMMLSIPIWLGYLGDLPATLRDTLTYTLWILTTPVVFWGGWPFLRGAWSSVRHRIATMDLLIAVGAVSAYAYSVFSVVTAGRFLYFDTASFLISFLLLSRALESQTKRQATQVVEMMGQFTPREARVQRGDAEQILPLSEVRVGEQVIVNPAQRIPVDGVVAAGEGMVDESLLTGESQWIAKRLQDTVYAGTLNQMGKLVVRATRVTDTLLQQTADYVRSAQANSSQYQRIADNILRIFVPVVFMAGMATFGLGMLLGRLSLTDALLRSVAVLVIGCPCALSVATPLAVLGGIRRLNEFGILLRKSEALERASRIDTLVVDKTGTMTTGQMTLQAVFPPLADELWRLVAAAEYPSGHPVGKAIVRAAAARSGHPELPGPTASFEQLSGWGVKAVVDGRLVTVGAVAQDTPLTSDFTDILETWRSAGYTLAIVTVDGAARAVMSFADGIRPDATGFVSSLASLGVRVIMASGDHAQATETVAQNIGADQWHSRLSPVDKAELVRTLQLAGHSVAFIGDGVNDAPALVQADLGVAMGSGADIAVQTGHFILTRSDLTGVPKLFQLSRQVRGTIRVNLGWAISYNAVGLAAAAFGLASPAIAALAMLLSSAFVLGNSMRIIGFSPKTYARRILVAVSFGTLLGAFALLGW